MIKRKRQWWRTVLVVLGWLIAFAVAYVVSETWKPSTETKWAIAILICIFAFNHAFITLSEKLDSIIWRLDDIERRLSPEPDDENYP